MMSLFARPPQNLYAVVIATGGEQSIDSTKQRARVASGARLGEVAHELTAREDRIEIALWSSSRRAIWRVSA